MTADAAPEHTWPDTSRFEGVDTRAAWPEVVRALPAGTQIAGEVIGRQGFGVFLGIDGHPAAIGLAEITAMPSCGCIDLPHMGERVTGTVLWHVDHNCQVKVLLSAWAEHPAQWPRSAGAVGSVRSATVGRLAPPIGVFVRMGGCVQGFIRQSDLPSSDPLVEDQEVLVRIVEVEPVGHRVRLMLA